MPRRGLFTGVVTIAVVAVVVALVGLGDGTISVEPATYAEGHQVMGA